MRYLILILALSGCAHRDAARCQSYGLQYGSGEYAQCMMQRQANRQQAINGLIAIDQANRASRPVRPLNCYHNGNYTTCF